MYVSNTRADTTPQGRTVGEGNYILGPDQSDILSNGDTASTAGFSYAAGDFFPDITSPFRLEVGPSDHLYISDWSDSHGGLYRADADVSLASGELVLAGIGDAGAPTVHGNIASNAIVEGSLATGDLTIYALEEDLGSAQALWRWDIGSGPLPHNAAPTLIADPLLNFPGVLVDLDRHSNGNFFLMQTRFNGFFPGVVVVDADGNTLYDSLDDSETNFGETSDILKESYSMELSPDETQMAISLRSGDTWIIPLVDGLPDLAKRQLIDTHATGPAWSIAWDEAGNIYTHSEDTQVLRVFSPGGDTVATTTSGGVFSVTTDTPTFTADFDGDGDVDGDDLAQWEGDFGVNGDSDADANNVSDGRDFVAWLEQVGSGLPKAATIPEPTTAFLLTFGAAKCMLKRRRV